MNILDEAYVHQLRNVISETKEIVHLYLEVFQGLLEQTEAVEKIVPYNVENVVSDNVEECLEEETMAVNTVDEKNLYEFGRVTDKTLSDGEESNEGWLEDEFTHGKKALDIFYGMPPIPDCPDLIVEPAPFHSLGPNDDMFVCQTYDNKQQLIFSLSLKATRETFQFKTKHSNKNRYEIHLNHKHANKKVMGTILHEIMGKTRSKVWRPKEISSDLNALLEINVDYKQAWHEKQYAMELLLGSSEECFYKLPIYFHNMKMHNPGTVTYIQTDSEDCFECCFYAIGSTGDFKGTILHPITMDGNNQILPLVHGICKRESGITWTWFLEKLYECVGDCQELIFVTDSTDAIWVSIENVFPHTHHGLCDFHLLGNIVHRFSSTRPQVAANLSEIPHAKWTRAFSLLKQYDYKNSNSVESMNALSVDRTTGWSVSGVSDAIYQVPDFKHGGIVDLRQDTCTCKYWEGTGLPCGHVIMVLNHLKKTNLGHLAIDAYKMETYRSMYEDPVYPLPELCDWEIPVEMMIVKSPIMDTRQAGRPRNRNRISSQGEEPIVRRCSRCDSTKHNAATCPELVPKKQKRLQKVVRHQDTNLCTLKWIVYFKDDE
ncbi:unnamed protein product [Lactuca saligna]|uniref:SWIM-type domain-containing protein n=1 Tax=Lactuca saligna TaxID=75948 RepID=A0AA35YVU0_LACSI|nr:unnamed protein product [Lactuca saligna]